MKRKNYSFYQTKDGSFTLFNERREEHYHSFAGAYQEAKIKYFEPCQIEKLAASGETVHIFELGFGLGYNLLPILDQIENFKSKIVYHSTENDRQLFDYLFENAEQLYPKNKCDLFKEVARYKTYQSSKLELKVYEGEARKTIQNLDGNAYDAIFHDPFSPYKNSECWTLNFFKEEFRLMKKHAILSSYSMSTPVRSAMHQAGFMLWEGIGDETKTTGTIASKIAHSHLTELSKRMRGKLFNSPDRFVFLDNEEMNLEHLSIKKNRMIEKSKSLGKE